MPNCRIVVAGCVDSERRRTGGRVADTGCIVTQCSLTSSRVELAGCVPGEALKPVAVLATPVVF